MCVLFHSLCLHFSSFSWHHHRFLPSSVFSQYSCASLLSLGEMIRNIDSVLTNYARIVSLLILLCFLLSGTNYLSWTLMKKMEVRIIDRICEKNTGRFSKTTCFPSMLWNANHVSDKDEPTKTSFIKIFLPQNKNNFLSNFVQSLTASTWHWRLSHQRWTIGRRSLIARGSFTPPAVPLCSKVWGPLWSVLHLGHNHTFSRTMPNLKTSTYIYWTEKNNRHIQISQKFTYFTKNAHFTKA